MSTQARRSPSQKILVRGLNWLGDAVISTAALQRLRQAHPEAQITLLSHEKLAGLWLNQPFVDEVIRFTSNQGLWKTAKILGEVEFDVALAFPNSIRSALELWLARIPKRIGYARPWRTFFLTNPVPARSGAVPMHKRSDKEIRRLISGENSPQFLIPAAAHHVHDYLGLVAALGASPEPLPPCIVVTEAEQEQVHQQFGIDTSDLARPWFGLNPGAEYGPAKRWPADRFIATALELHKQTNCRWLLFGGNADVAATQHIADEIERGAGNSVPICLNLSGKTSLRQLSAALKTCRLLITNDTGPMHLASAVGTPVIVPFGSTSPELTGPTFAKNAQILKTTVPCSPCFRRVCPIDFRCLTQIEPQQVIEAAKRVLEG